MDESRSDLKLHVFVCTNQKVNKECCAEKGGEELRAQLKEWAKQNPEWRKRVRINSAGCLDRCKEGIAIAAYPQNKWLLNVGTNDIEEVKAFITRLVDEAPKE